MSVLLDPSVRPFDVQQLQLIGFSVFSSGTAVADDSNQPPISCRAFRAKRMDVPVYRFADTRSEVIGRLRRSEEVCGLSETKDFISIRIEGKAAAAAQQAGGDPQVTSSEVPLQSEPTATATPGEVAANGSAKQDETSSEEVKREHGATSEGGEIPRAYVRTVDLWPPRAESTERTHDASDWLRFRRQGVVPDDPFSWIRSWLSFFTDSPQNAPRQGGTP